VKRLFALVFLLLPLLATPLQAIKIPITGRVLSPDGKARTPAMAAGVESRKLEIADLIALLPDSEVKRRSK
jgi:hypothetical protein